MYLKGPSAFSLFFWLIHSFVELRVVLNPLYFLVHVHCYCFTSPACFYCNLGIFVRGTCFSSSMHSFSIILCAILAEDQPWPLSQQSQWQINSVFSLPFYCSFKKTSKISFLRHQACQMLKWRQPKIHQYQMFVLHHLRFVYLHLAAFLLMVGQYGT